MMCCHEGRYVPPTDITHNDQYQIPQTEHKKCQAEIMHRFDILCSKVKEEGHRR